MRPKGGKIKDRRDEARVLNAQRLAGLNADRKNPMKFKRSNMSFGQNAPNTSARAPGSNGPGPLPAPSAAVADGRVKVITSPGDPNFPSDIVKAQMHPKSKQVPTHPAHSDRPLRGSKADANVVLEAGAIAANGANDWAGE
jgi:hypothetical protein